MVSAICVWYQDQVHSVARTTGPSRDTNDGLRSLHCDGVHAVALLLLDTPSSRDNTNALRSRDVLHSRYTSGKSMVPLHLTCNGYGCSVSV